MSTNTTTLDVAAGRRSWFDPAFAARHLLALRSPQYSLALTVTVLGLTDFCVLISVFCACTLLWSQVRSGVDVSYFLSFWPFSFVVLAVYVASGLYQVIGMNAVEELRRSVVATSLAFLVLGGITLALKGTHWVPRMIVVLTWLCVSVTLPVARSATRKFCAGQKWFGRSVVVLGAGKAGEAVIRALQKQPGFGLKPVAVLAEKACAVPRMRRVGNRRSGPGARFGRGRFPLWNPRHAGSFPRQTVGGDQKIRPNLRPAIVDSRLTGNVEPLGGSYRFGRNIGLEIHHNLLHLPERILKRAFDLIVVALFSPFLVPLFCMIGCLIKLTSRGPLFFGHRRIGQNGGHLRPGNFAQWCTMPMPYSQRHLEADPALAEEWRLTHKLKKRSTRDTSGPAAAPREPG